jgi:hypothetical protein
MRKAFVGYFMSLVACTAAAAPELTPDEVRWLQGVWPVIVYARAADLPLDVIVQPQAAPEAPPLALAYIAGRCKLVLSMRGNPAVQETLQRIEPEMLDITLELMAAHELGHCRRYISGSWYGVPAGFVATLPGALKPEQRAAWGDMQAVRREEGYADLVGLAWTQRRHPAQYARLHAWLLAERADTPVAGSHHDTRAWVHLAARAQALASGSMFDAADALWPLGLRDQ